MIKYEVKTKIIYAEEFEEDSYLDVLSLGKEVFVQSSLNNKYEIYVTNLTGERDDLQTSFDYEKDLLQLDIREDQENFGINPSVKLTEKIVNACINTDKKIQEMIAELLYVNKLINEANGALRSIRTKARSLDNAVQMYKTGYWGELTAMPVKMQEEIDNYLNRNELSDALKKNTRLINKKEK